MKEKFIIFMIGLLLGSILSTGSIFIYTVANSFNNNNNGNHGQTMGQPPQGGQMGDNGQPPELPNGNQDNR